MRIRNLRCVGFDRMNQLESEDEEIDSSLAKLKVIPNRRSWSGARAPPPHPRCRMQDPNVATAAKATRRNSISLCCLHLLRPIQQHPKLYILRNYYVIIPPTPCLEFLVHSSSGYRPTRKYHVYYLIEQAGRNISNFDGLKPDGTRAHPP
jgi:hypothetical protein